MSTKDAAQVKDAAKPVGKNAAKPADKASDKQARKAAKRARKAAKQARKAAKASQPSIAELQAEVEARRARLANTVDRLAYEVQPSQIVNRQKARLESSVNSFFKNPDGSLRTERVAAIAGGAALIVGVAILGRRRAD